MEFHFDLRDGNEVRNTINGIEVIRPVMVTGVPIAAGSSDPSFLFQVIADAGCPQLLDAHPTVPDARLEEHQLRSVDRSKRHALLYLVYRGIPTSVGTVGEITFLCEQGSQQVTVTQYGTAGGLVALSTWYKPGEAPETNVIPAGIKPKGATVIKVQTYDALRATGRATRAQWIAVKAAIRGARGKIHSDAWGTATRGKYLFLGPSISYFAGGRMVDIRLDFLGSENGHFPLIAHFNEFGERPSDTAPEATLRSVSGLPAVGAQIRHNGMTLASVYDETPFTPLFNFTPDD